MSEENKIEENEQKNKMIEEVSDALNELEQLNELEYVIEDNKIVFEVRGDKYRIRKPEASEQKDFAAKARIKYTELMWEGSYRFRKEWIEKWKLQGYDIEEKESESLSIQSEINNILLRMAELPEGDVVKKLVQEVKDLRKKQFRISCDITDKLEFCIESQMLIYQKSVEIAKVLEVLIDEKWTRYFPSIKEFEESEDNQLISKACYYYNEIFFGE